MHRKDFDAHNHGFTGTNAFTPYPKAKTMRARLKTIAGECAVFLLIFAGCLVAAVGLGVL